MSAPVYVYVIGCKQGPVKIGIAGNPQERLRGLRTGCFFPIEILHSEEVCGREAATAHEQRIHAVYKNWRLAGEWFDLDSDSACMAVQASIALNEFCEEDGRHHPPEAMAEILAMMIEGFANEDDYRWVKRPSESPAAFDANQVLDCLLSEFPAGQPKAVKMGKPIRPQGKARKSLDNSKSHQECVGLPA